MPEIELLSVLLAEIPQGYQNLPMPLCCISYHDPSASHRNGVSLHHTSDGKGEVCLVMCEMMNKTSGNFFGRGQWGENCMTLLGHHQLHKSRNFAHLSNNEQQMGGKKGRFDAGSNFCAFQNVSSFQLNLDLLLIKRVLCVLLPQKTGIASRMLKSQVPAPRGVMEAFLGAARCRCSTQAALPPRGPWTASHVCPSTSPHCHHCRRAKQTQGMKWLIRCCTASLRCTSDWKPREWIGASSSQPIHGRGWGIALKPTVGSQKGTWAVTERDKTERQVSNFSRRVFSKKKIEWCFE